jgi:hypothetical protein
MKYIFVAGVPGSKWSSVVKNIYYSPDVDRSDYRDEWTYYHDASGQTELMHLGAYFDPGMECNIPEDITALNQTELQQIFDAPFDTAGTGVRVIKSHIFSYQHNFEHLMHVFSDSPLVLVYRPDDACLGWWVKCGHFDITYPSYAHYYQNLREMSRIIAQQNRGILQALSAATAVEDNVQLCADLGIAAPPVQYRQIYSDNDICVKVLR